MHCAENAGNRASRFITLMTVTDQLEKSPPSFPPATYADWRATVEQELKGVPLENKLVTRTPEGIDVQPLYRREDAAALKFTAAPGEPPYLRGARRPDERGKRWEACTEPSEYEFSPLPALALALTRPGKDAPVRADPLGWLASHGSLPMRLALCFDDAAEGMREAEKAGLSVRLVGIGAHLWHEGGATAVQELAFALATGADYWRQLADRGITPAPRRSTSVRSTKSRAMRLSWGSACRAIFTKSWPRNSAASIRSIRQADPGTSRYCPTNSPAGRGRFSRRSSGTAE